MPALPARWFWGAAATLRRDRARSPAHYPSRVDRELFDGYASLLLGLVEPESLVDLAPAANRHVRALATALVQARRTARCVLHDTVAPRLVAAVRRLAADFPNLDVAGVLTADVERPDALGRGARLVLVGGGGPDGPDTPSMARLLRGLARRLDREDAAVVSVDLGADPAELVRACRADGALALHRAAFAAMVGAFGGEVDPSDLELEAEWDTVRRCVETRLRAPRPLRLRLPYADVDVQLRRPLRTGRVGTWSRPALRRVAARAGLVLQAWLPDADERRALALLRPGACLPSRDRL